MNADSTSAPPLLVDTNLLVLYVVGRVNRGRIESFKRTRNYAKTDYDLLLGFFGKFGKLHTVPHVMAEVSNLADLPGPESAQAWEVLKEVTSLLEEQRIASASAAEDALYPRLGLVDAAIGVAARATAARCLRTIWTCTSRSRTRRLT